jgi:hypothetical protein
LTRFRQLVAPTWLPLGVHVAGLVVGAAVLVWENRSQWFFGDEWDFLVRRGVFGAERGLFAPHNEHWSTVPILVYRALFSVFGARSYLPYVGVVIAVHIVLVHLLWRLMLRTGTNAWVATMLSLVVVAFGAGFENLLWAFQLGFVASVLGGIVMLLLLDHDGPFGLRDGLAIGVGVVALTFSGVTVTMVAVVALAVAIRRGVRIAALVVLPLAVIYGGWLAVIGKDGLDSHPRTFDTMLLVPKYVLHGITSAIDQTIGTTSAGIVVLVLVIGFVVRRAPELLGASSTVIATAAGALVLYVVNGLGRSALGIEQAQSSRYTYIAVLLLLPAFGLALTEVTRSRAASLVALAVPLAIVVGLNLATLRSSARTEAAREQVIKGQILAAAELVEEGEAVLDTVVEPTFSPDLTVSSLRRLVEAGELPTGEPTAVDRLNARSRLQVGLDDTDAQPSDAAVRTMLVVDAADVPAGPGCHTFSPSGAVPQVVLEVDEPSDLTLTTDSAQDLQVRMRSADGSESATELPTLPLHAGAQRLRFLAGDASPILLLPKSAPVTICGLAD